MARSLLLLLLTLTAHVDEYFNARTEVFVNQNCAANDTCALKTADFHVTDYKVVIDDKPGYGTNMHVRYQTDDVKNLESFGIVQFIRGCHYETSLNPDGTVLKQVRTFRELFGERAWFHHPEWIIDSVDVDALYNSIPATMLDFFKTRHGQYRTNSIRGSTDKETQSLYYERAPQFPELYVSDIPSGVFATQYAYLNASMEFKTCVYRTSDIPQVANPKSMRPEDALHCFDWDSKWTYNFNTKGYERGHGAIDEFCLAPLAR